MAMSMLPAMEKLSTHKAFHLLRIQMKTPMAAAPTRATVKGRKLPRN